jgi:hypothetical protein
LRWLQMLPTSGGICNSVVTWMVLGMGAVLLDTLPNMVTVDGKAIHPATGCTHSTTPVSRFKQGITYMDPWRVQPGVQVTISCADDRALSTACV